MNAKSSTMTCGQALAALLGDPDQVAPLEVRAARAHASRCPRCSSVYDPDEPDGVWCDDVERHSAQPAPPLRIGLFVIALVQVVFAVPWLLGRSLLPDAHVAVAHLTRDGALGLVIAGLGLVTVWRPRYVHSTMIIGLLVFGLQLVSGLADQQTSSVSLSFEVVHLLVVVIVFGLFGVAANLARRATPVARPESPVLRTCASRS